MCAKLTKMNASTNGAKKVAPVSQTAPLAPWCPAELCRPSCSTITRVQSRPGRDTGCGFIPKSAYLEHKLTAEVNEYAENEHRETLKKAENLMKTILRKEFKGIQVWTTGSLPAGVDLHSSDLDMTVKLPETEATAQRSPIQKLFLMKAELQMYTTFSKVWVQKARVPVLQLVLKNTGVEVDVTIDNDDGKRNTQLLAWYGQVDPRVSLLCKAVKGWASSVGVEGARNGRLNSFTLCLMAISFLQVGVTPAILPNVQELFPELDGVIEVKDDDYQKRNLRKELEERGHRFEENRSSVGSLFAGFLKYYAEFDFLRNWISVRRGRVLEKRWDEKQEPLDGMPQCSQYIVVEDPFIKSPWNCGGSVWHGETFERLQQEFQLSFDRLVQTRSIFAPMMMSISRRKCEEAGMERDLQLEKWKKELADARVREWIEEDRPWGGMDENFVFVKEMHPYEDFQHPETFWDLKTKKIPAVVPWPEAVRCWYP